MWKLRSKPVWLGDAGFAVTHYSTTIEWAVRRFGFFNRFVVFLVFLTKQDQKERKAVL